jgi:nicotinamide-nucleotide amidase
MLDQLKALGAPCTAILLERGQSVAVADESTGGLISAGMLNISGGTPTA